MSLNRARLVLLGMFLASLLINGSILWHFEGAMEGAEPDQLSSTIFKIHAVPIGILLGALFAVPKPGKRVVSAGLCWSAFALSGAWIVFLLACWHNYPTGKAPESVLAQLTATESYSSYLIAALLAYFSCKSTNKTES